MVLSIFILALAGFAVSLYSYFIERKKIEDPAYQPFCDISKDMSCSKPVLSPYGKTFGISNSIIGMAFYALMVLLTFISGTAPVLFALSIAACVVSVYLAYILYFRIGTFCLLCFTIHVINVLLLIFSYLHLYVWII